MSIAKILVYPDPILRATAKEIDNIDDRIVRLTDDMVETMYAAPAIGLAAPQVGFSERLIVVDVRHPEGEKELITLVNPEILEVEGEVIGEEGCLSLPGVKENITRANKVLVRGYDLNGKEIKIVAEGLLAVALQHEIDHLMGILLIDRVSRLKRGIIQRKLRKVVRED
jgi:peptide deformylase